MKNANFFTVETGFNVLMSTTRQDETQGYGANCSLKMKSELKLSYIPMCPTYHMCCHIFGVFDFCEVTATKIRHMDVGPRAVGKGGGPICPPPP